MSYKDGFGLREKQSDGTEYRVGAFIQFPPLATLPETFELEIPPEWVRTQKDDTCASEAFGNLLSRINGNKIDALLAWALARANNGYSVEDWGVDLKSIAMATVKGGAPIFADSPYHSDGERSVYADITKWDLKAVQPKAIVNKAGTAVEVQPINGADLFDSIKMTLHKLQAPVAIGVRWNWPTNYGNIEGIQEQGYGHAMLVMGWDEERLIVLNSWGKEVGTNGYFYFPRDVINHDIAIFGAWTLIDETPEKVKWHIDNGIYLNDGHWLLNIAKAFIVAIKQALKLTPNASKETGVPPYPLKVVKMAEAIKQHEGFYPGSRAKRNNSPSNAKYLGQYKSIGPDAQGFARFATYEDGWNYLLKIVYNACSGKSVAYQPTMTLYGYFAKYAPSADNNDPKRYAEVVAEYIGVSPFTTLNDLLV